MSRLKRIRTRINKENLEKAQKEGHITEEQTQEVIDTNGLYNPYTDTYINPNILPEISVTTKAPERTWTSEWTYNDPEFRLAREHRNITAQEVAKSTRDKMNQVGNAIGKTIIGGTSFTPLWFAAPIAKAGIAAYEGDYSGAAKEAAIGLLAPYAIGKGLEKGIQFLKIYKINRALNQGIDENAIITGYQRNSRMMDTGTLQQYQQYLDQVFPETKIQSIQWHGGKKGIQQLINPGNGNHIDNYTSDLGIYVTPKKSAAMGYRKNITSLGQRDIPFIDQLKANFGFGKVKQQTIDKYTDIYPVKINANNVVSTYKSGTLTPEIVNSSGVNTVFKGGTSIFPEYVYTNPDQGLILGSNKDLIGFQNFIKANHCGGKLNYLNYIK